MKQQKQNRISRPIGDAYANFNKISGLENSAADSPMPMPRALSNLIDKE